MGTKKSGQYLITGASGKLGRELVRQLEDTDEALFKTHEALDITNHDRVNKVIQSLKPTVVINTAAINNPFVVDENKYAAWQVNAAAVDNLVKCCAIEGIPLMQISTGNVFGIDQKHKVPYREVDPTGPTNYQGMSKLCGEMAVLGLGQCMNPEYWNHSFRYWVIRTSELFDRPHIESRHMLSFITRAMEIKTRIGLAADVVRSPTYVVHLAKTLIWIVRNYREVVSGVYHIANRGAMSYYDMGRQLSLGIPNKGVPFVPRELDDMIGKDLPRYAALNCEKWHDIAPFPMPTCQEAIDEFAKEFSRQDR